MLTPEAVSKTTQTLTPGNKVIVNTNMEQHRNKIQWHMVSCRRRINSSFECKNLSNEHKSRMAALRLRRWIMGWSNSWCGHSNMNSNRSSNNRNKNWCSGSRSDSKRWFLKRSIQSGEILLGMIMEESRGTRMKTLRAIMKEMVTTETKETAAKTGGAGPGSSPRVQLEWGKSTVGQ